MKGTEGKNKKIVITVEKWMWARYPNFKEIPNNPADMDDLKDAAQVLSAVLIGAKTYINVTNFRVFDTVSMTKGPGRVTLAPLFFMNRDVLLED